MPARVEVYNADGSLQFSLDSRILKTLTTVNTGTDNGSVTVSNAAQRQLVAVEVDAPVSQTTPTTPVTSVSGNVVSWSFGTAPANERQSVTLNIMAF